MHPRRGPGLGPGPVGLTLALLIIGLVGWLTAGGRSERRFPAAVAAAR